MYKILDFGSIGPGGEPTLSPILPGSQVKIAASNSFTPAIMDYVSNIAPQEGKLFVVVNALGAGEYYGCNINGDHFPENVLRKYHHTFVSEGKPFMHHLNKDPSKCYGEVLFSDYNDKMHRVELVVVYDTSKLDPKYVQRMNDGELVNVSMGCRVPWDICCVCGNKAKTPRDYCKHLTSDPGMGRMFPDGRRAFAINLEPTFFDISIVTIPADPTARILLKVAQKAARNSCERAEMEGLTKAAETLVLNMEAAQDARDKERQKDLVGIIDDMLSAVEDSMSGHIYDGTLNNIGRTCGNPFSLARGLAEKRVFLRPQEAQRAFLSCCGREDDADILQDNKIILVHESTSDGVVPGKIFPDTRFMSMLPDSFLEERTVSEPVMQKVVIRMMMPTEKVGFATPVDISSDYRFLDSGESGIEALPSALSGRDTSAGLKDYVTTGAALALYYALLKDKVQANILNSLGVVGGVVMPGALADMRAISEKYDHPVEQMIFPEENEIMQRQLQVALMTELARAKMMSEKTGAATLQNIRNIFVGPICKVATSFKKTGKKSGTPDANLRSIVRASKVCREYVLSANKLIGTDFTKVSSKSKEAVILKLRDFLFGSC